MMLVIPAGELRTLDSREEIGREEIDREAQSVVIEAYGQASEYASGTSAFDAALKAYREKFPHIAKNLASQAVACILAAANL
jgi:hypothetical protein